MSGRPRTTRRAPTRVAEVYGDMLEDRGRNNLTTNINAILKALPVKILTYHTYRSDRGKAKLGFPDWVYVGPGGMLVRELKSTSGRLTAEQQEWLDAMQAAGVDACVWTPADLLSGRIARELGGIASRRNRKRCDCPVVNLEQYGDHGHHRWCPFYLVPPSLEVVLAHALGKDHH